MGIRVAWFSPMDLPNLNGFSSDFELLQVNLPIVSHNNFDLVILDAQFFESLEALKDTYFNLGCPTVILIDTIEQESAVLVWLKATDETCRRDAIAQQIYIRLTRTLSHSQQDSRTLDAMTGLASRHMFDNHLQRLLALNSPDDFRCLICLDLDRFKVINDSLGHMVGDQVLVECAQLLQQYALGADIVARLGGDEFVICMRGSLEQGKAFAEFLRAQIESHEFSALKAYESGVRTVITASFGVACSGGHFSFESLMKEADQSLYAAKGQGRNCVVTTREFDAIADAAGKDGLLTDLENRIQVATARMTNYLLGRVREISRQYREEADRDGLTGIFNRRHLDRLLLRQMETARRDNRAITIALLDLDRFGEVNKTYGFPTGDRTLKTVAEIFQQQVRATDWVTRYGGEEFCILMPDTDLSAGCQVAERIRLALSKNTVTAYNGKHFQITVSIGLVQLMIEDTIPEALIQRASDKVREAKNGGRNQIRF